MNEKINLQHLKKKEFEALIDQAVEDLQLLETLDFWDLDEERLNYVKRIFGAADSKSKNARMKHEEAIRDASGQHEIKFILILPPEMSTYLEWAAQERRMHKAQIVRQAVEHVKNKDREYQSFLEEAQ